MRKVAESIFKDFEMPQQSCRGIDIKGCADSTSNVAQINVFGMEHATFVVEMIHVFPLLPRSRFRARLVRGFRCDFNHDFWETHAQVNGQIAMQNPCTRHAHRMHRPRQTGNALTAPAAANDPLTLTSVLLCYCASTVA